MSAVDLLDKTAGASKTDRGLSFTTTEDGEEVLISEHPSIGMAMGIPTVPALKWTAIFGPLSWTVPGIEVEEEAIKTKAPADIWDKPNIIAMLTQPVGTPVSLTRDEALEISRQAFGSTPDLMLGEEFVSQVRPLIGRSILRKIKKSGG